MTPFLILKIWLLTGPVKFGDLKDLAFLNFSFQLPCDETLGAGEKEVII
jgi:hypothetical protein